MVDSKYLMSERSFNMNLKDRKDRVSSGILGLDEMLGGGFPVGHIIVVVGDAGTGKTTLALQYITEGLIEDESGIYITIEEEKESIISTADSYGWNLEKYIKNKKLALLKLDLSDIKTTARRVKNELPELIRTFGAKRLVIDSITLFSMMFNDTIERRIRLTGLNKVIKKAGITSLYTAEIDPEIPHHSRDGIIEFSADGMLYLHQNESAKDIELIMRIVKMRRIKHDRLYRPYEITEKGIVVHSSDMVYHDFGKNPDFGKD
jgi:KaiC domain protein